MPTMPTTEADETNPANLIEKPWGTTVSLCVTDRLELCEITVLPGGYSSLHYHSHKFNAFVVVSGTSLIVASYKRALDYEICTRSNYDPAYFSEHVLTPQRPWCFIPPRVRHRFRNIGPDPIVAYEIYWPESGHILVPADGDIVRFDKHGRCQFHG